MKRWIAVLLMACLLLTFCGCDLIPGKNNPTQKNSTQETQTEMTENPLQTDYEEISVNVTDAVNETLTINGAAFTYAIPMIVCDCDGISEINNEIYKEYYDNVYKSEVIGAMDEYGKPDLAEINYMWGVCGDYLSLVVYKSLYDYPSTNYSIWNVDLREGVCVSDEKIVEIFDYDMDSFYVHAGDVMGSYCFDTNYGFIPEELMDDFYKVLSNTISIDNIHEARPYIGEDGMLWMIAPIGSVAGAEYYVQQIPFESYPVSDEYLNYVS